MKYLSLLVIMVFSITCSNNSRVTDRVSLLPKLGGKWTATAFDGRLDEEWSLHEDGWLQQRGYYIEQSDTSYSAITKIEQVGKELILFSVIKDGNPKIFKAVMRSDDAIVFQNRDYQNPYEVKYEFLNSNNYRRTITGYEQDSLIRYEFNFKKH